MRIFAWLFFKVYTTCLPTAKALARLRLCAGSAEPLLVAHVMSTIFSCAGSYKSCGFSCFSRFVSFKRKCPWNCQRSNKTPSQTNLLRQKQTISNHCRWHGCRYALRLSTKQPWPQEKPGNSYWCNFHVFCFWFFYVCAWYPIKGTLARAR